MNKGCIFLILLCISIIGCTTEQDVSTKPSLNLTTESVMSTYTEENRGINLSDSGLSGFISLNGLTGETEIVNISLSNNEIEVLNISEYSDLGRLIIDNNKIRYFSDVKYPEQIRHINLSYNDLDSIEGIEKLTELKTLDLSYNNLQEEGFQVLGSLKKLEYINIEGNNISEEFLQNMNAFNSSYLGGIKN